MCLCIQNMLRKCKECGLVVKVIYKPQLLRIVIGTRLQHNLWKTTLQNRTLTVLDSSFSHLRTRVSIPRVRRWGKTATQNRQCSILQCGSTDDPGEHKGLYLTRIHHPKTRPLQTVRLMAPVRKIYSLR